MNHEIIYNSNGGFIVETITKASDKKLSRLEEQLSEAIAPVEWANIDDLGYLSVSWVGKWRTITEGEKTIISKIINKLF